MIYCFDLDDTLCSGSAALKYEEAKPFSNRIDRVNQLYDAGNTIKIFTARGSETGIDWRPVTEEQLSRWGVRYHVLLLGKPAADVYVDDKACHEKDFAWSLD